MKRKEIQSLFPNYGLSKEEVSCVEYYISQTGRSIDDGELVNSQKDFIKCMDTNIRTYESQCDEVISMLDRKKTELPFYVQIMYG